MYIYCNKNCEIGSRTYCGPEVKRKHATSLITKTNVALRKGCGSAIAEIHVCIDVSTMLTSLVWCHIYWLYNNTIISNNFIVIIISVLKIIFGNWPFHTFHLFSLLKLHSFTGRIVRIVRSIIQEINTVNLLWG